MTTLRRGLALSFTVMCLSQTLAYAQVSSPFLRPRVTTPPMVGARDLAAGAAPRSAEPSANSLAEPRQILRTGINLNTTQLSPNSMQLADIIKLTPVLQRIENLRAHINLDESPTSANMADYTDLLAAQQLANQKIQKADLSVDYVTSEIYAEQQLYAEILSTLQAKAARKVQYANWAAYWSNGATWAIAEALDIPTWKRPKYSISSGINGIIAGILPSMFSLYAMHVASGPKYQGEGDANMLAKILGAPTNTEVQYPDDVWTFLNSSPQGEQTSSKKTRKDQLIDRWIADSNMPSFTDRSAKGQIQAIAATGTAKKEVSISLLQTRITMLTQLAAEVGKMKRMLYELSMAVSGEKQLAPRTANLDEHQAATRTALAEPGSLVP